MRVLACGVFFSVAIGWACAGPVRAADSCLLLCQVNLSKASESTAAPEPWVTPPPSGTPVSKLSVNIRVLGENRCLEKGAVVEVELVVPGAVAPRIRPGARVQLQYDRIEVFGTSSMHHTAAWNFVKVVK